MGLNVVAEGVETQEQLEHSDSSIVLTARVSVLHPMTAKKLKI